MVRWVEWALEKARTERHHARAQHDAEPFEQYLWDGTFHWGEWTEPKERDADGTAIDPIKQNPMAWFMADKGEVGTAYLHRSTATLARVASILGHEDAAARYGRIAEQVRRAWQAAYLHADGTTAADTQAGYVRALSFDLIPEQLQDAAAARLVELIRAADTHLRTGFLSTGDLLPVLCETGHADLAYDLLFQRTAPSWLNMIDHGATTIWEDWEGIDDSGAAHESLNHYSKGAVIRFLHTHTLGLQAGARCGGVGVDHHRADPRPLAHVGSRLAREPAGTHHRRLAHRRRRDPHRGRDSGRDLRAHRVPRRHPSGRRARCLLRTPQPAASLLRPDCGALTSALHCTPSTRKGPKMTTFPEHFLWGAATAGHQIEGNNVNSDWWAREQQMPGMELSGDACDSYHRYAEDIQLLADAGLTSYRFSLEWSRIEPIRGHFSRAELAHYRRVIDACLDRGITPVVTLQHFTTPQWFAEAGGWSGPDAKELFVRYVEQACTILDGVEWVATMNEPNMQAAIMTAMARMAQSGGQWQSPTVEAEHTSDEESQQAARNDFLAYADPAISRKFVEIHHAAREVVRARTAAKVGWTIAAGALTAAPGGEEKLLEIRYGKEDIFWEGSRGDDWAGVQAYSSQQVDANGLVPHPQLPDNTLVGTTFRPDSLAMAVRHATEVTQGVPILITENGIATADDTERIRYTTAALEGLLETIADGIDVRGYLHWSLLDNFEWGHWEPTFGLIAIDRETFARTPKPSLAWLGQIAQHNAIPADVLA